MAEFSYNNAKNISTGHTSFELNYRYHPCIFYEENRPLLKIRIAKNFFSNFKS